MFFQGGLDSPQINSVQATCLAAAPSGLRFVSRSTSHVFTHSPTVTCRFDRRHAKYFRMHE
jgi:hypothetical protein